MRATHYTTSTERWDETRTHAMCGYKQSFERNRRNGYSHVRRAGGGSVTQPRVVSRGHDRSTHYILAYVEPSRQSRISSSRHAPPPPQSSSSRESIFVSLQRSRNLGCNAPSTDEADDLLRVHRADYRFGCRVTISKVTAYPLFIIPCTAPR